MPTTKRHRIRLPRTLFGQLSTSLFLIAVVVGVGQSYVAYFIWSRYWERTTVELYRDSAGAIADQLEPEFEHGIGATALTKRLYEIGAICPELDPFILDATGNVVGSTSDAPLQQVNLAPLESFRTHRNADMTILKGDNPRGGPSRLFSVAPMRIGQEIGYVYILLGGQASGIIRRAFGDSNIATATLLLIGISFTSAFALGILVFYHLTRRFRTISAVLERFEGGDFEVRLDESGADEIAAHARAFNRMASTLVKTISSLKAVDESRRALVAAISHDLRSPLSSIALAVDRITLRSQRAADESLCALAQDARGGCNQLESMISDLFELSRLDAGETLQLKPCSFHAIVSQVLGSLAERAARNSVQLQAELHDDKVLVLADEQRLIRLLNNLVENAIEYSGSYTIVSIRSQDHSEQIEITVADNGCGIPESELSRLFDWFFRGTHGMSKRPGGSGLGLAICRRIVELHGSSLTVQSTIGFGTTFRFSLRRADCALGAELQLY